MQTEEDYKRAFAAALLKLRDPIQAAMAVSGGDTRWSASVAVLWANDQEVKRFQDEIIEEFGENEFVPSSIDVKLKLWEIANSKAPATDRIKALEELGKMSGYYPDKSAKTAVIVNAPNIMRIPMQIDDPQEWGKAATNQQKRLKELARDES